MKSIAMSLALASALLLGSPSQSSADVSITITIGPGYNLLPGPGRLSCRSVANRLINRGYRYIRVVDCRGAGYVYDARRNGNLWRLTTSAITGDVKSRAKLR